MKLIRTGRAPADSLPFFRRDGKIFFDGKRGRELDYGHTFHPKRGYQIYFRFTDTPGTDKNTWLPEALMSWVEEVEGDADPDVQRILKICRRLAKQVATLNEEWIQQGRRITGIVTRSGARP